MLLIAIAFLVLTVIGFAIVAKATQIAMRRLGAEPMAVLLFFGLAEAPRDELAARRAARRRQARPARSVPA